MPRFPFGFVALMSCTLMASAGCGGNTSTTGGGAGGTGGASGGTGGSSGGTGGTGGVACVPEAEQCDGFDNDCDDQVDEGCPCSDGDMQSCYSGRMGTDGVGACTAGTQTCDLTGTWGPCTGEVVPAIEACNGADDDCNGAADDMGMLTCGVGACLTTLLACDGGTPGTCLPGAPSLEICDGIDNNCNQLVDESFPNQGAACDSGELGACMAGTTQCVLDGGVKASKCVPNQMPQIEDCNSIDDDCDGTVDDEVPGTGGMCDTGELGPCAMGAIACQGGTVDCFATFSPVAEICGDAVDNDCNGTVDDPPGLNMPCDTGQLGACAVGLMLCSGGSLSCVQQNQAQATDMCGDNVDNDCDGTVDEGCLYTFSGVQTNVPIASLTGWTQCYMDLYNNSSTPLTTILAQCNKNKLLLGCRTNNAATLIVAAHAPRTDVTFDTTGDQVTLHQANGVGWYYNNNWSWGFVQGGDPVQKFSCDVLSTPNNDRRMCWHTGGGNINSGYRCGTNTSLNGATSHQRLVFHAD
jgi:hypothetical protein